MSPFATSDSLNRLLGVLTNESKPEAAIGVPNGRLWIGVVGAEGGYPALMRVGDGDETAGVAADAEARGKEAAATSTCIGSVIVDEAASMAAAFR